MGPLSDDPVAGHRAGASLARARAVPAACRTATAGSAAARLSAKASLTGSTTASASGPGGQFHGGGLGAHLRSPATAGPVTGGAASGEKSKITWYRSVPETPSTMQ